MPGFDEILERVVTPDPVEPAHTSGDVEAQPTEQSTEQPTEQPTGPGPVQESPTSAGARMLEAAAVTADRLVVDAQQEAETLVSTARAKAEEILEASRREARHVDDELARRKDEQAAELDRERATALAGLAEEKAALEARISDLQQLQDDYSDRMRHQLNEQLSLLDAAVPEPPASSDG
jgi:cell division septum initiation protein DivIVA